MKSLIIVGAVITALMLIHSWWRARVKVRKLNQEHSSKVVLPKYIVGDQLQIRATPATELTAIGMDATIAQLHEEITGVLKNWPVDVVSVRPSERFNGFEYVTTDETRNEQGDLVESVYPEICLSKLVVTDDERAYLEGDTYEQHADEMQKVVDSVINDGYQGGV